ncbi:STAS domain-containing protein [Herminiimonas fonticola]|nr:STAS domain-containing protein [Herminiimonas fonticola]
MFQPGASLTFDNAKTALDAGLQAIAGGQTDIDFSSLVTVDSAAVATMLAWQRIAVSKAVSLSFRNIPANLLSLISLYDVTALIAPNIVRADLPHH